MQHTSSHSPVKRAGSRDWLITTTFLSLGAALSAFLNLLDKSDCIPFMVFVLMVVLTARLTNGYLCGIVASFFSVICVNFVFTYPYWELNFTISGYPLTFLCMLSVSLIVSATTSQIKRQEKLRMETDRETMRANLLRAISHDLRTPLTSIIGSTSAILENDDVLTPDQKTSLLRNVRDEAQWLIRMVENLLSITRISGEDARLNKELEAAEEVLASVSAKFQKRFSNIHLTISVPDEPLFVPMDVLLVEQILMNLMENAAYHGQSSQIFLSVESQGQDACFTVRDNGSGIPPEILTNIFSPNLRSKSHTSDQRRNMGIGLSVCSSIVRAHGGTMFAENAPEGGAVFRFLLPSEHSNSQEDVHENQR